MSTEQIVLIVVFAVVVLVASARLFTAPFRVAVKLLINTVLGFVGLFLFNLVGQGFGVTLGLNFFNAGIIAVLGLPGFGLLLLLQWLFGGG